ncbi:MAG: nitrogen fixation protein [Chloroflexi bacterium]|nr:nitrogen fixation protein [Chloroflexota bacterium]
MPDHTDHDTGHVPPSFCPSAQPEMEGSVVFGVVGGDRAAPRVGYLTEARPVTPELLALTGAVPATEVFRIGAPCAASACRHFDGARCTLATRVAEGLPIVADTLPACRLRPSCRWWQQEGKAACMRCPQVVTQSWHPSDVYERVATPQLIQLEDPG